MLPEQFVPQIEDAGLAAELTELVAASAFADMAGAAIGPLGLTIGINLPLEVLLVRPRWSGWTHSDAPPGCARARW